MASCGRWSKKLDSVEEKRGYFETLVEILGCDLDRPSALWFWLALVL